MALITHKVLTAVGTVMLLVVHLFLDLI